MAEAANGAPDRRRQAAALRPEQRTEFAPDPHDFVAHHVTGVVVQARGARARLELEGAFDDLPVEVTTTVHRVVMEALTDVRKHAHGCAEVRVRVERSGSRLTVRVSDDGRPRHVSRSGSGLKGLDERVGLIGGRVQAGPVTAGGWGVEATFPVSTAGVAVA